jgi:hypothetical protein
LAYQGFADFHHLLTRQREILNAFRRVNVRTPDLVENLFCPLLLSAPIDQR